MFVLGNKTKMQCTYVGRAQGFGNKNQRLDGEENGGNILYESKNSTARQRLRPRKREKEQMNS